MGTAYYAKQFTGRKAKKILKTDTLHYVHIQSTLTKLLECPHILSHDSGDKIFRDMCDGSVFRSHPILQQDRKVQVIAYFDEVELYNP